MLTIYVSRRDNDIVTTDGCLMTVKRAFVSKGNSFVSLQDLEVTCGLDDVELVFVKRFFQKTISIPSNVRLAILEFLRNYHSRQDISFDCYAFANLVMGVDKHKVPFMLRYWDIYSLPWRLSPGSIVFFLGYGNLFYHAAVYLGSGLFISVWGAGGDLEISTLRSMKKDFGAQIVLLAVPKK